MLKRWLLVLILSGLWPAWALAESDVAPSGAQDNQTAPAGGSTADTNTLQPSVGAGLGSAVTDSSGLTAASADSLQSSAVGAGQLRVLSAEADGEQHRSGAGLGTGGSTRASEFTLSLFVGTVLGIIVAMFIIRRMRRRQSSAPDH